MNAAKVVSRSLIGAALIVVPRFAFAQAQTLSYLDLQAGPGYSTNPLLVTGDKPGSSSARLSGFGFVERTTERSATNFSAYLENASYSRRYGSEQIFSLAAHIDRTVSERARLFGDLGFTGDRGGVLGSRIFTSPSAPVVPDPTVPGSLAGGNPDLTNLTNREYRLTGQLGTALTVSARDSLTVSAGAQRVFTGGSAINYSQYDGSAGYERQVSERLTAGGRLIAQYTNYSNGGSMTSIGPQATVRAQLSEVWDTTMAIGVVHWRQNTDAITGNDQSFDLALDGSLCRNEEFERLCARISRRSQPTVLGGASTSTSAGVDFYRRLNRRDTLQVSASVVREADFANSVNDQRSTYYNLTGSCDRKINDRMSAGANVAARRLVRIGPDPKSDVGGSLFIRYRLGDVG